MSKFQELINLVSKTRAESRSGLLKQFDKYKSEVEKEQAETKLVFVNRNK